MTDLLFLLCLIIPIIASVNVSSTYKKMKKFNSVSGKTGFEVAREMLDRNGLSNIYVVETPGELTDHYDSRRQTIRLSTDVFHGTSIASLSVAAHECGHAIQDKEEYGWMTIRKIMAPVVNLVNKLGYIILIIALIFEAFDFIYIGILLVGFALVFQVVTLPVEFDASNRAKKYLYDNGIVNDAEKNDVAKMLGAAALTYVAGVITSVLDLIRILMIFNRRD